MENLSLKVGYLSYTQRMDDMENKTNKTDFTKGEKGLLLTATDVEEYYAYKKQKKMAEVMDALARSEGVIEGVDDVQRAVERALRIHQAAVRVYPTRLLQARERLSQGKVRLDCWIGAGGETLTKVKAYEVKLAKRLGASELTLVLTPSLAEACRYAEIRKELRKIKRVAKKTCLKIWVDKRYPYSTAVRLARLGAEMGVQYISIPYFAGCERLRFELFGGCQLEVVGVETLADFKKMVGAGAGRIVTAHAYEFYNQWMKEVESIRYTPPKVEAVKEEKAPPKPKEEEKKMENTEKVQENQPKKDPETDYRCRLEGTELKFL